MKEIALNILDIVGNSVRAQAKNIRIEIIESDQSNSLVIKIIDDGKGMDKDFLDKVDDPFTTSRHTRRVGLGIPLLKQHAELAGGVFSIQSYPEKGTTVSAEFRKDHIDRQPIGDICGVLRLLLLSESEIDFEYYHSTDKGEYEFSGNEAKKILEVDDLNDIGLVDEIINILNNNLIGINAQIT